MIKGNIWKGVSWIGYPAAGTDGAREKWGREIETACFHHDFNLEGAGNTLTLSVSASSRYRLWVNGTPVVSGPCKSGRWEKHYETVDVSGLLREGGNVLAVKVVAFPPFEAQAGDMKGPFWFMGNAAGPVLIVQGCCLDTEGVPMAEVSTGIADWSVLRDLSIGWKMQPVSFWMGSMEIVDLAKAPNGWNTEMGTGSTDSIAMGTGSLDWKKAETKWKAEPNGFGELFPFPLSERPIPLPYERARSFVREMPIRTDDEPAFSFGIPHDPLFPDEGAMFEPASQTVSGTVTIPPHTHAVIELDAGELTTAFLHLPLSGGQGSRISLTYAESYSIVSDSGSRPVKAIRDDAANGRLLGNGDEIMASGHAQTYEPFLFRTFRFVRIVAETADDALTLSAPSFLETGYPLEVTSGIRSSESWMEPLWDMSVRTLQRCMHESYMDCPYYEQLQYTMDTRLQMLYTYAASGDDRLARKAMADYHASLLPEGMLQSRYPSDLPQVIPAFALHWVFMLEEHWWQTGSPSEFRRYRPTVDAVLDWFDRKSGPGGLVTDLGHWDFADWVEEWDERAGVPFAVDKGPSTIHNLVYAAALQAASRMMRATGREGVGVEYAARASAVLDAVDRLCWSEEEGLFREGPDFEEFSQHAQVWAVLCGLAEGDRARRVMEGALRRPGLAKCSFPWMFTMFRALEKADMYQETEALWDLWRVLIPQNLTTIPEIPFNTRSDCHAWGSLPLYEFPRKVLGVNQTAPGWDKVMIEPKAHFLADASGEAITPKGPVFVAWHRQNGKFCLKCRLPEGMQAEIRLPNGSVYQVAADAARTIIMDCPAW